jgi:hypothetical protein
MAVTFKIRSLFFDVKPGGDKGLGDEPSYLGIGLAGERPHGMT